MTHVAVVFIMLVVDVVMLIMLVIVILLAPVVGVAVSIHIYFVCMQRSSHTYCRLRL